MASDLSVTGLQIGPCSAWAGSISCASNTFGQPQVDLYFSEQHWHQRAKYGTTFDNRLLVIDKTGPTTQDVDG
jgi:hypothetical protein